MEQQQFKVSFSLGTKLLLSIVLLLVAVIVFLNVSTILILTQDKRAYVYESQSTEAVLAGREFANTVRHSIDTLRLSLASVDPRLPSSPKQAAALQSVIDNQSDFIYGSVSLVNLASGTVTAHTTASRQGSMEQMKSDQISPADLTLTSQMVKPVLAELKTRAFALIDVTQPGGVPMLGVLLTDLRLKDNPTGAPVGFGVLSLKDFAKGVRGANLAVGTTSGRILFDSDLRELYAHAALTDDPLYQAAKASSISTGAMEFNRGGERYLGSYVLPGYDLLVLNRMGWKKAIRSTYALGEKFVLLGLLAVSAAVIFAIVFSKTLTSPINRLYQATREVAGGKFDLDLKPSGRDEIGALTSSFNVMSRKISDLIHESMEKVKLENELAIASTVQQTLIPPEHFKSEKILIESHYQAASQCGGDWWGFFGVGDKMAVMIADATGHGFPSALITASARSCFSVMHKLAQEDPEFSFSPSAMLSYANRVIYDASLAKIMMTFFVGAIDFGAGKMTYGSAGHNPPWLFKKEADAYRLNSLVAVGQRLGEAREAEFEEKEIAIAKGDVLFMYTDGLTEGKDLAGEMFGKKRVRKIVEAQVAQGPKPVVEQLIKEFMAHNEGKPLDDDVTIAVASML